MGFFNQSLAQLRDLFGSMTPAARITSALLLGVIVVSLSYLFQGYAGASEELLFNGEILQPREADRVEAAIAKAGLKVLQRQAGRIVVPRGQTTAYLAAIASDGALPANFDTLLEDSLETGLFENSETKKARLKAARERQLSMILAMMDGIDDAKVLYDVREPKGFEKRQVTAMVSVMPEAGAELDAHRRRMIREAVAGAIGGLAAANVTILDLSSGSQYNGSFGEISADSFNGPYYQERTRLEQHWKARIEDLLRFIQPAALVQVTAELDDMLNAEIHTVKPEGDPTALRESSQTQSSVNSRVEDRGQPGPVANGPNGKPADQAVAKNENTTDSETSETENVVPMVEEKRQQTGLTPKSVRAAIALPSEYLVRVWRESNPDAKPEDRPTAELLKNIEGEVRSNIETLVAQLFPKEIAELARPNVEVTVFQSLTPDPVEPPSLASEGLLWAGKNSGSLIMAGLAVVSLTMLRSMVRSIPAADTAIKFAGPTLAAETVGDRPAAKPAEKAASQTARDPSRPRLRLKKGPTLKDDLTEIVKDDPDGAAAILRTWIGNAS